MKFKCVPVSATKRTVFLIVVLFSAITNLKAQVYSASNFTLLSLTNPEVGVNVYGDKYSACWGWTQPVTNREYAIACSKSGTYWVDVTNPVTPAICAFALGTSTNGVWRETKTYQNYCYVISDDGGPNTFQIFDMSALPSTVTMVYNSQALFKRGHACWVDGNKLYVSGVTYSNNTQSSMDVYSLATPSAPVLLRRLNQDYNFISYVHDMNVRNDTVFASCGNQGLYVFKFNSGNNTFTQLGSLTSYTGSGYNHSTSWTPDGQTIVMMDEVPASLPIKIVNVSNLANMQVVATTNQFPQTTPHNPWIVNNKYCFASSYQDGTQLYDISNPSNPILAGYFDTFYQGGGNNNNWAGDPYDGQWGLYAYFPSKNIFALDQKNGIFMLSTHLYANPKINIQGNGANIMDGSIATNTVDNTDFGLVTAPNSLSKTFVVENTGVGTLSVSGISITGANAAEFSLIGAVLPFTVATASSQTLTVQFTPLAAGTRSALVTINNNDINKAAYDFVIAGTGSINATGMNYIKRNSFNIALFPNPAQNEVQFNIPWYLSNKDLIVTIYDTEGKLISEKHNSDIIKTGTASRSVQVSELSNGIYYFNLIGNGKNIGTKKLVIAK
jgi:choice-of-anchor B domain-containing protein